MAASNEDIRKVVDRYVELVATGTAAEIADLYAEGATVEDPVGSEVLTGREQILGFYAPLEAMDQETRLIEARVVAGEAAFHFEVATLVGDKRYTLSPFDVMVFDDDARIVSMRAFWGDGDLVVS